MKRLASALLACSVSLAVSGQNIFQEDFQSGIPGTWTLINNDGLTPDSTQTDFVTAAWVEWPDPDNSSNTIAVSTSKYLPPGQADDWLITPAIALGPSSILNWQGLAFSSAAADGYEVRISTTTPTIAGFQAHPALFTIGAENTGWTKRSADLTGYPNATVYIAFRNNSNDRLVLGVDDVVVFDCNTISANAGTIDTSTTSACAGFPDLDLELVPSYTSGTPTTVISGNTNDVPNWDPLAGRPFHTDGGCCETYDPPYEMVEFEVTMTGSYTVVQTPTGYDGVFYIYTDPLDLSGPFATTTYVAGADDFGTDGAETVVVTLTQGEMYYLISTGYLTADTGNYVTTFTGPGSILVQQANPGDLPFDYNFVVTSSGGRIVSIGDDLTNTAVFPGSPAGDTFTVCGISYVSANFDLQSFVGQQYSVLEAAVNANSCADLTDDCHTAVIISGGTVDAGVADTVCSGSRVTLTATGGVDYVWNTGETTASIEVAPIFTTIYTVTATDNIGCTASDNVTVKIHASDGGEFTDAGPTSACEGDSILNFALEMEFYRNFFPTQTNIIIGNTVNFLTWAPLPGRPEEDGDSCTVCYNPVYDVKPFQVDQTGYYFIGQSQIGYDGIIYLYGDPFDLTVNPPITFIAGNDDSANVIGYSYLDSLWLEPSRNYYLVSTGFDAGEYGDYITTVRGAGDLMLPGQPDTTQFGFEYLTVDSTGDIIAFSQDLRSYAGSATGVDYEVCAVSYLLDSISGISNYIGQPFTSLEGTSCLDPSDNCHSVKIFTQPVADAGPNDTVCLGDTLTLAANSPGGGQGSWNAVTGSGIFLNSANPSTKVFNLSPGVNILSWTITVGGNCADSDTMEVFVQTPSVDAGNDDTICRGESATLTATGGVSYTWSTNETTASIAVAPVTTTNYIVTATDVNGCSATDTATVIVNPLPLVTLLNRTICAGSCTVFDAGHPGSTYSWSTGDTTQTATVCTTGPTCVTVTDINGCSGFDCGVVTIGSGFNININNATICDGDSATLDVGIPGLEYIWSTGDTTQAITVDAGGVYKVTASDSTGCSGTDSATVTVNPSPLLSLGNDTAACAGSNLTITASGTGSFSWSTGATTSSITVNPAQDTTYSVTLTAANSCTASDTIAVTANPVPNFDLGPDFSICRGESTTLTASGGTQYSWSTGATTDSITVAPNVTTIYSVTVTNSFNCSLSDNITITVNASPIADAGANDTICGEESIVLTASGGGAGFSWSTGGTASSITITPSASQYYHVTVTASNGCTASDSVYVHVYPSANLDLGSDHDICSGSTETLTAEGGGTYSWSTGATTDQIDVTPSATQMYSVTVTTVDGCVYADTITIMVAPGVNATVRPDTTICDGQEVILYATGGTEYYWSHGADSSITPVSPSSTTTYSVTVANSFGCEDYGQVTVTVKPTPQVTLFGFDTTVYCISDEAIIIGGTPRGGIIQGSGFTPTEDNDYGEFIPANAGVGTHIIVYSLTGANGCTGVDSEEITVDPCNNIPGVAPPQVIVYPNPAEQFFFVKTEGLQDKELTVNLYDPIGKLIFSSVMENKEMKIDLAPFASGTYLVQIRYSGGGLVRQLVKN